MACQIALWLESDKGKPFKNKCQGSYQFTIMSDSNKDCLYVFGIEADCEKISLREGKLLKPDVELRMAGKEFVKFCEGRLNIQSGYMNRVV